MQRIYRATLGIAAFLVSVGVTAPIGQFAIDLSHGSPAAPIVAGWWTIVVGIGVLFALLTLVTRALAIAEARRQAFKVYSKSDDLRAEVFAPNLLVTRPGDFPRLPEYHIRTLYGGQRGERDADVVRTETNVLLIADPADGATRTLFEMCHALPSSTVIVPWRDRPAPTADNFAVLRGKEVTVVIDDIQETIGGACDIKRFLDLVREAAGESRTVRVLASTHPSALAALLATQTYGLADVVNSLSSFRLEPMEESELSEIASERHIRLAVPIARMGLLYRQESLGSIQRRFATLSESQRALAVAIADLDEAGVLPVTFARAAATRLVGDTTVDEPAFRFDIDALLRLGALKSVTDSVVIPNSGVLRAIARRSMRIDIWVRLVEALHSTGDDLGVRLAMSRIRDSDELFNSSLSVAIGRRLVILNPEDASFWRWLALALERNRLCPESIEAMKRAIEIDNTPAVRLEYLGVLAECGASREAIALIDSLPESEVTSVHLLYMAQAHLKWKEGDGTLLVDHFQSAVQATDKVIALDPSSYLGFSYRSNAFDLLGDHGGAVRAAHEAVRLKPRNAGAWQTLASSLLNAHRTYAAGRAAECAVQLAPSSADAHWVLARVFYQKGNYPGASAETALCLTMRPNDPEIMLMKLRLMHLEYPRYRSRADLIRWACAIWRLRDRMQTIQTVQNVREYMELLDMNEADCDDLERVKPPPTAT